MKDVFIVNPKSGKNSQYELIQEIKEHFQGKRIIIEKTKGPEHATFIAKKYALSNEPVHLYVCGGDGTLHEVINGCAEKENVTISVIPIGTGNDFVKYFEDLKREDFLNLANYSNPEYMDCDLIKVNGCAEKENVTISVIPIGTGNDFVKYFEDLKREDFLNLANYSNPEYMDCDLIKVNGEYSINTVSFGFDVEVARQVNALKKNIKTEGIIPYVLSTLISLRKPIGQDYQIQIDTKKLPKGKYGFLVFANGKYYGGGFKPCPDANIDDGWMDVCLISDVKRHQIVRLAKKYQEGTHTQYKNLVSMYQAKTIHLNTENEMIYANMDGEVKGFKNPTIEIVEKAIRLALPRIS